MDEVFPSDAPAALPRDAEEQDRATLPAPRPSAVFAGVAVAAAAHLTLSLIGIAAMESLASVSGLLPLNAARGFVCMASLSLAAFVGALVAGSGARSRSRVAGLREGVLVWSIAALVLFLAASAGFDAAAGFDPREAARAVPPFVSPDRVGDASDPGLLGLVRDMTRSGRALVSATVVLTSVAAAFGGWLGARRRATQPRIASAGSMAAARHAGTVDATT